jgi:hypothetical protein
MAALARYDGEVPVIASSAASSKGKQQSPSLAKRIVFAILFGVITTGMTFYVITFGAMYRALGTGKLNPAMSPGVTWALREIGIPVSVGLGVIVFSVTLWRSRQRSA